MVWRQTAGIGGVAAAAAAALTLATPAQAQGIERTLVGIKLNTTSKNILARYGNPTQVVVGETGVRLPGGGGRGVAAGGFGAASASSSGFPGGGGGGYPGGGGGYPGGGGGGYPGGGGFGGGGGLPPLGGGGGYPGGGGGYPGGGGGGGYPGGFGGGFGGGAGLPGGGDITASVGGGGGGAFGNTSSTVSRQQEVTWIYDRSGVSYEFLIGADGRVIQIKAIGYKGGNAKTSRGVQLGSSYATALARYGYPEQHQRVGPILIASYRNKAHTSFQFLNNKVIAITIATVE
jgi:hypothetical protein